MATSSKQYLTELVERSDYEITRRLVRQKQGREIFILQEDIEKIIKKVQEETLSSAIGAIGAGVDRYPHHLKRQELESAFDDGVDAVNRILLSLLDEAVKSATI